MKRYFIILFLVTLLSSTLLASEADRVDKVYKKAARNYHLLYQKTPFRAREDNWISTINKFQAIYKNYPSHPRAPMALFNIGNLYRSLFKWNHKGIYLDRSNIAYRTLTNEYPNSNLADNGLYNLAQNYEKFKKDKNLAYLEFKKLVVNYPKSKFYKTALAKIKKLQPTSKDMEIAPALDLAVPLVDLTVPRYGGLTAKENKKMRSLILVSKVDYWSTTDWSRLVINIKNDVRYKYQVLKADKHLGKGRRLYIDLSNTFISTKFKKSIAANDGMINQARIAQFDKKTVRVVLDLASLKGIKVYHLKLPNQYKIIIDMFGQTVLAEIKSKNKPIKKRKIKKDDFGKIETRESSIADNVMISLSKALGLKVKRIILDPGHGGKDPGALGFGLMEKDIALKIAFTLKAMIEKKNPDIEVLMTRKKDVYLSLEARTAFANKYKGDLFISIHLNASRKERIRGIETYFLNLTSDNEALALAAKENQTSLKSISQLQSILNDLMTNSKIKESNELANKIQHSMIITANKSKLVRQRNLGVKKAPFFVLLGAQMPSVLVETGFITNRIENKLMKSASYRKVIARGIYKGIYAYIN